MQLALYLLGTCLIAGAVLLRHGLKHAPVGTETEDGFVAASPPGSTGKAGVLRSPLAATRRGLRPGWEPLVRT